MLNVKKALRRSKRHIDRPTRKMDPISPAKKPKVETSPTKITDVNVDCLERIFEHLDVTDLNNVAEAHTHFVAAARLIYKREHSSKTVKIFQSSHMVSVYDDSETAGNIVNATAASFLRNFGDLVNKLRLDYSQDVFEKEDRHHWREIERVTFEHCTKTLIDIQLINCRGNVLEEIRQPFGQVINVYVYDITGKATTVNLSKWFPNTRQLELDCGAMAISRYAKGEFPRLNELRLLILNLFHNYRKDETNIRKFLRRNHHIRKLSIDSKFVTWLKCDFDFLSFINQTLTQLQKLRWIHMNMNTVNKPKRIHFKHVRSLELQVFGQFPDNVSISFDHLKSLKLYGMSGIDRKWVDFIVQNKSLIKLGYFPNMRYHQQTTNDLLAITTELPNLNTVYLQAHTISPQNLGRFLNECKTLTNLMSFTLKFFAGFKNDLAEYLSVVKERYFKTEFSSMGTCDEIVLHRINNEQQ